MAAEVYSGGNNRPPRGQIRSFKSFEGSKRVLSRLPCVNDRKPTDRERATRPTGYERGYGHDWNKYRIWYLRHNPFCALCGRLAALVDHIRPMRFGGSRMDTKNHQPLCRDCHAAKTASEETEARAQGWTALWGKGVESLDENLKKPAYAPTLKN